MNRQKWQIWVVEDAPEGRLEQPYYTTIYTNYNYALEICQDLNLKMLEAYLRSEISKADFESYSFELREVKLWIHMPKGG